MKSQSIKKRQVFLLILMLGTLIFLASFTYLSISHAIKMTKEMAHNEFDSTVYDQTGKIIDIETHWLSEILQGQPLSRQIELLESSFNPLIRSSYKGIYSIVLNDKGRLFLYNSRAAVNNLSLEEKTMKDIIELFKMMIKNNESHHLLHMPEGQNHDLDLFLAPIPKTSYYLCIILDKNKLETGINAKNNNLLVYFTDSIIKIIIINIIVVTLFIIISIFTINDTIQLEKINNDNSTKLKKTNTILEVEVSIRKRIEDELKEANNKLKQLSLLDGLTGIANRRAFDINLGKECKRNARDKNCLTLALIDVDFFKNFNDYYGHHKGDICLKKIAMVLAENCHRPADMAARYGGEEFAAILPETDEKGAIDVTEKIMAGIASQKIPHEKSAIAQFVTVSIGIAVFNPDETIRPEELVKKADFALYRAKEKGRNQICIFESF